MKRKKPLRKKSLQKSSTLQHKIWEIVRLLVFKEYGTDCYTCDAKNLQGPNRQCGHLWAKASLGCTMKYDRRILRPQCYLCNIRHGGMGAVFYARMLKEIGQEAMDRLEADRAASKRITTQAVPFYASLLEALQKPNQDAFIY